MNKTALVLLGAAILSFSFPVHAEIYTWIDENGKKHFGDEVPEKYKDQKKQVKVKVNTMELKKTVDGVKQHLPDPEEYAERNQRRAPSKGEKGQYRDSRKSGAAVDKPLAPDVVPSPYYD